MIRKNSFFYRYGYSTNPVNTVDPDGQWFFAALALTEWYIGNSISYGSMNPGKWDWSNPMLWFSTAMTALRVGMDLGNDFSQMAANHAGGNVDASDYANAGRAQSNNGTVQTPDKKYRHLIRGLKNIKSFFRMISMIVPGILRMSYLERE